MKVQIADIKKNRYEDGPGIRVTIFFQGCNVKCLNCHNKSTWDIKKGKEYTVEKLVQEIMEYKFPFKKITISGGEPLFQKEALIDLISKLYEEDFEIALYTSYELENIPVEILEKIRYLKTGKFIEQLKIRNKYYGSSNQHFYELSKGEIVDEK